ncbi:hypothetical protein [Streptomyces zaomyceticus]|uniref:hypothetical protein n=1 Tax=Streptomyces zaomyceticus TaxID=68286 RepID=UPI00378806D5
MTPVPDWVVDRGESDRAVAAVCANPSGRAVAITTSLEGAGGFGKTTLATVVCAHPRVRRHFRRRVFTITIGRDVRGRAAIATRSPRPRASSPATPRRSTIPPARARTSAVCSTSDPGCSWSWTTCGGQPSWPRSSSAAIAASVS